MGKCSPSQDGIVVENIILYNYVYNLFYFIYSYDVILTLML